jgi:hypothetical protein
LVGSAILIGLALARLILIVGPRLLLLVLLALLAVHVSLTLLVLLTGAGIAVLLFVAIVHDIFSCMFPACRAQPATAMFDPRFAANPGTPP